MAPSLRSRHEHLHPWWTPDIREVNRPLVYGDVSIFLASLIARPDYILAVCGIELGPAHGRDRVGSMHLVVCGSAARRGTHQRSHHAGKQAHARRSAAKRELIERDTAAGSKLKAALIVEYDDGVTVGAGDDSIADVYAHPGRRSDRRATAALNLHLAADRLEMIRPRFAPAPFEIQSNSALKSNNPAATPAL